MALVVDAEQLCSHAAMKHAIQIWALVPACAGMFILCNSLSTHWGTTENRNSLIAFVALSPVSYGLFALINKRIDLAIAGALVNTMIAVGTVLVGVLLFKEQLSTLQYVNIGFAIASVTLLNLA